jgi:hypothetical protein
MRLHDLVELFLDDDENERRSNARKLARDRKDTSSLADIARILHNLDRQDEKEREISGRRRVSARRQHVKA